MVKTVECEKCGDDNAGIPKNLKCSKCGKEYVFDKKRKLYFPKYMKCEKCHKMSGTITSEHVCDKCGAEYSYYKKWPYSEGLYIKKPWYKYERFQTSDFFLGFVGDIGILIIALIFAVLLFSIGKDSFLLGFVPLAVVVFMAYRILRRLAKAKFKVKEIAQLPKEEKLSEKAEEIKKEAKSRAAQPKA